MMVMRRVYFITSGILAHICLLLSLVLVARFFDLTPQQFTYRLIEKSGVLPEYTQHWFINRSFVDEQFPPPLIPTFTQNFPRILKQAAYLQNNAPQVDFSSSKFKSYNPCAHQGPMWDTACYLMIKDPQLAETIKQRMLAFDIVTPNASGHHSNGWQLAFIYDAVKAAINLTPHEQDTIESKLEQAIIHYLLLLNDDSPSLWHGRTTLSAQLWLTFIALDSPSESLMKQVTAHFYGLVEALEITEGWPEGFNYWINARGIYVALALSSYLQGTEYNSWHPRVKHLAERIGLWHIYATRPDWQIEGIGDEGPRVDLKDETRRVIDILQQATGNQSLFHFSQQLHTLHGRESYYRGYRWGWSLFNEQVRLGQRVANDALYGLPTMAIFGADYFGQTYIHQHWQPNKTFISYRAGDTFTHHGHADNGHFSVFKGAPLLVNSSQYQGFTMENRLNYSIRTVAKNSLMIDRPSRHFDDGGQRVPLPTGSAILSPKHWFEQRVSNTNLAGGKITAHYHNDDISFIGSDLTRAYDSTWYDSQGQNGKVRQVTRHLLYLHDVDTLFIQDTVQTTNPLYPVSALFHTINRPQTSKATVIKGNENNGIIVSDDKKVYVKNGKGRLTLEFLMPFDRLELIGGKDYQFYVKSTHLPDNAPGLNMKQGVPKSVQKHAAQWRIAVYMKPENDISRMVTVIRPSIDNYREQGTIKIMLAKDRYVYVSQNVGVMFYIDKHALKQMPSGVTHVYMCDAQQSKQIKQTCLRYNKGALGSWYAN